MRKLDYGEFLKVGDILKTSHAFGGSSFVITRVTKRYAFSKRESDGYEYKFAPSVHVNMAVPRQLWNTTRYDVFRDEE